MARISFRPFLVGRSFSSNSNSMASRSSGPSEARIAPSSTRLTSTTSICGAMPCSSAALFSAAPVSSAPVSSALDAPACSSVPASAVACSSCSPSAVRVSSVSSMFCSSTELSCSVIGSSYLYRSHVIIFKQHGACLDVNRGKGFALDQFDQGAFNQFKNGDKGDHHAGASFLKMEQRNEGHELAALEHIENVRHALAGGQLFARHVMALEHVGAHHHVFQCQQQFLHLDIRVGTFATVVRTLGAADPEVAFLARQFVHVLGGFLEALVFLQATDQFGARIFLFLALFRFRARQQAA